MDFGKLKEMKEKVGKGVHEDDFSIKFYNFYDSKNILTEEEFDLWLEVEGGLPRERVSTSVEIEDTTYDIYAFRTVQDGEPVDDLNSGIFVVKKGE